MSSDLDAAIRVVVTPSQSSYFAGEPFSVTITFTNTRSPESLPLRAQSHTHKRGAHSISSAPLARPPTSPGTPRTAVPAIPTRANSGGTSIVRKGFIGKVPPSKGTDELPDALEKSRKRLLAKSRSLSVTLAPHEVPQEPKTDSPIYVRAYDEITSPGSTPTSSQMQSPFGRSPTLPPNHPHARKQSVFDGQISLTDLQSPVTSSASNSTFSLSLDPIAESMPSPFPVSVPPTPTTGPYLNDQPRRPSQIGIGHPGGHHAPPRTAFASTFPQSNSELILYSYAQLTGTLSVTPMPGAATTSEQANNLNSLRAKLLKRSVVGGGSMDITSSLHSSQRIQLARRSHKRSSSFSSGLFSFISAQSPSPSVPNLTSSSTPSLLPPSQSWSPSHRPRTHSQSSLSGLSSPSPSSPSGFLNGSAMDEEVDPETPLPTFEVPQVMLAVDLCLGPGESRSYTYSLPLPDNLPPTFKGRMLKFSYQFVVGTCRAGSSPAPSSGRGMGPTGANSVSRVMKVPIRVYNNVFVGRPQRPYDLLWPVAKRRTFAIESKATVTEDIGKLTKFPTAMTAKASPQLNFGTFEDLRDYARLLLASFPDPDATGVQTKLPAAAFSPVRSDLERELEREEEGALTGCREAVEILTRNPKKVSYDVNKDGVKVAVLTFTKSAYRLGETVLGVVELNERTSRARVLSLSAILEAHESLPSSISHASASRQMHRVHAEHHSSFVHSCLRTTFTLDIPSDASPAFQVSIGDGIPTHTAAPTGGLEWKVRLCLLVAVAADSSDPGPQGVRMKHLVRDGPRGEWGSSWKAAASIAPMEHPGTGKQEQQATQIQTWGQFFAASFLGGSEQESHDEDDDNEDATINGEGMWDGDGEAQRDFGGGDEGWKDIKVETVECEVPIKVWPGNTAFKAMDVVFDV